MKSIKTFETWKNNNIDSTLFSSGKAKYDPKVVGDTITYKTGVSTPYYFAEISKKGDKFICKIYKKDEDGEKRLRNKIKKELQLAHNYVREFLNQRLKKDEEKPKDKKKKKKKSSKKAKNHKFDIPREPQFDMMPDFEPTPDITPQKSRTIIRRF